MGRHSLSGVYAIYNCINDKAYIGSSSDIAGRFRGHLSVLRKGIHYNAMLQRAWNKYGEKNFIFLTLDLCPVIDLTAKEQWFIDSWKAIDRKCGYNILPNARTVSGYKHSEESRANMRGRKRTPEQIEQFRQIAKTSEWTPERRERVRQRMLGNKINLGNRMSDETREKHRQATLKQKRLNGIFTK